MARSRPHPRRPQANLGDYLDSTDRPGAVHMEYGFVLDSPDHEPLVRLHRSGAARSGRRRGSHRRRRARLPVAVRSNRAGRGDEAVGRRRLLVHGREGGGRLRTPAAGPRVRLPLPVVRGGSVESSHLDRRVLDAGLRLVLGSPARAHEQLAVGLPFDPPFIRDDVTELPPPGFRGWRTSTRSRSGYGCR